MTIALILVLFSLMALLYVVRLARGNSIKIAADELFLSIRPVDIRAFRNLVDPVEEDFLHSRLSPADFRAIHRERLLAAVDYVKGVAHNAGVLIKMGEMARLSADATIAQAGEKLVADSLQLRLYAFQSIARLYIAILLPRVQVRSARIAEGYESMTRLVVLLGCLRFPTQGVASVL
jgi:hypothetical protein